VDFRTFVRENGIVELFDTRYLMEDTALCIRLMAQHTRPVRIKKLILLSEPVIPSHGENDGLLGTDEYVSVIIVTYNKRRCVLALIDSLRYLDISLDRLKVVVVDNCSVDGTVPALEERFGDTIEMLRMSENLGGSGGFNKGMRHVMEHHSSELIWLLDNDVVVEKETLSALVAELKKDERIGAAGSMMCKLDNQYRINELGGFIDWRSCTLHLNAHNQNIRSAPRRVQRLDCCADTSLLTRRAVISRIGYWDDMFIHFDDVEWCLRMNKAGWQVKAVQKSGIWHESAEMKRVGRMRYYDVRNFLRVYEKYRPRYVSHAKTSLKNRVCTFDCMVSEKP